jgi:hypothetical protein
MADGDPTLIYLDTNVYSRPFDDQRQSDIQEEANAFVEIIAEVEAKRLSLLGSDILRFEVHNILGEEKRAKVKDYLYVQPGGRELRGSVEAWETHSPRLSYSSA